MIGILFLNNVCGFDGKGDVLLFWELIVDIFLALYSYSWETWEGCNNYSVNTIGWGFRFWGPALYLKKNLLLTWGCHVTTGVLKSERSDQIRSELATWPIWFSKEPEKTKKLPELPGSAKNQVKPLIQVNHSS